MSKGLEELKDLKNAFFGHCGELKCEKNYIKVCENKFGKIEKELKEKEMQENALKTISDIIRDFNKGEFANGECALEEITNILKEVLL